MANGKSTPSSIYDISKTLSEVYARSLKFEEQQERRLDEALNSNSLSAFLLTEAEDGAALSKDDVASLSAARDKMTQTLSDLAAALDKAPGKFDGTKAQVESLAGEIPDPGSLANMILDPKPKEISKAVEAINEAMSDAGSAASSIIEAISKFANELSSAIGDLSDEDKEKTIQALGEAGANGELKDKGGKEIKLDAKRLRSGAEKAVAVPAWYQQAFEGGMGAAKAEAGGFFKQVGAFFKGLFGGKQKGIDKGVFADELMQCTVAELSEVAGATEAVKSEMEAAVSDGAEQTAVAQAGAEAAADPEAAAAQGGGSKDYASMKPEEVMAALMAILAKSDPEFAKKLKDAGDEAAEEALADEVEALQSGEIEDIEAAAEEAAEEGVGKPWEEVSDAVKGKVEDSGSAESVLAKLGAADDFKTAVGDKVKFEEGINPRINRSSLFSLLYEEVGFDDFKSLGGAEELGDDVDKQKVFAQVAQGINDELEAEVITDIPEIEEAEAGEPPPEDNEEQAEEAQEEAQAELESAVQDAAASEESPGAAVMSAIDGWYDGLSDTSKKSMDSKDRIGGLKSNIQTALDGAADTLSKAIGNAIKQWRGEHEETLIRSKRFAKKNFESLSELIPKMAQQLLKKTDESGRKLTVEYVTKYVHAVLDRHFNTQGVLMESLVNNRWARMVGEDSADVQTPSRVITEDFLTSNKRYDEDDLIMNRWGRIAGLGDDK